MKRQKFTARLKFAWDGILVTWKNELSFRTQIFMGVGAILLLVIFKATAVWWALFSITIGSVLAAELINTAIETLADLLHPNQHPSVKILKDCMAGAVLVFSLVAFAIFVAFLFQIKNNI